MVRQGARLELGFDASKESPLVNLALVVKNWDGSDVALEIDDRKVARGKDFRFGVEYDVEGNADLIVWIRKTAKEPTKVSLAPVG